MMTVMMFNLRERNMKLLKKTIVITLILSMLTAGFCFPASALVIHEGDFGFEVNTSAREAKLVSYSGNGESVRLPDYFRGYPVTVISKNAFSGNASVREVTFSGTNTTVEEYAFMGCSSLETVTIPENVVNFGDRAFAGCASLKTVTLLSDMVSMPTNMFSGCSSLENLTINESIADFGYGCFNRCSSLKDLDFVKNGAMLDSYAFNGTGAESVVLSGSLLAIPNYAFTNCPNLKYVTIPESVALIQPYAFDWEKVTIRCYLDSCAYHFAKEKNIPYELIDAITVGDVNDDSDVNICDVTAIQRHLAELEQLDDLSLLAADANRDGKVDISDATAIQMFLAKYEVPYPISKHIDIK